MGDYNSSNDLHDTEQGMDVLPLVNSTQINIPSEVLPDFDSNVGAHNFNKQPEETIEKLISNDVSSNIFKQTDILPSNTIANEISDDGGDISIEIQLEKMHGGIGDTVNEHATENADVDDKMDWTRDIADAFTTSNPDFTKDQHEANLDTISVKSVLEDKNVIEAESDKSSEDAIIEFPATDLIKESSESMDVTDDHNVIQNTEQELCAKDVSEKSLEPEAIIQSMEESREVITETVEESTEAVEQSIQGSSEVAQESVEISSEAVEQRIEESSEAVKESVGESSESASENIETSITDNTDQSEGECKNKDEPENITLIVPGEENKNVSEEVAKSTTEEDKNISEEAGQSNTEEDEKVSEEVTESTIEDTNVSEEATKNNREEDKNVSEDAAKSSKDEDDISHETLVKDIDTNESLQNKDSREDQSKNFENISSKETLDKTDDNTSDSMTNSSLQNKDTTEDQSQSKASEYTSSKETLDKTDDNNSDSMTNSSVLEQDKDKSTYGQRENTEFVQVNTEHEKDGEDNEKEDETNNRPLMDHDPIGSDLFEPLNNEDREGADEELCIIPDTEREISQAEKDAASTIPPLRDLAVASASVQTDTSSDTVQTGNYGAPIIIFKYNKEDLQTCNECKLKRKVKYFYSVNETRYLCDDKCLNTFKNSQVDRVACSWEEGSLRVKNFSGASKEPPSLSFIRKCASCKKVTNDIESNLTWEIMDFCNEFCLSKYQKEIGSHCSNCQGDVKANSLGKYCVRFGNDIRQFCTSACLEKYKKGLKVCSYCQQDMSGGPTGFLAPVGDRGQFKDFCTQLCMEKYDIMTNDRPPNVDPGTICSVCKAEKPIKIEFVLNRNPSYFCSEPCFVAFSFVNNITPGKCAMCRRHFTKATLEKHTMYYDNVQHSFCSNSCENIYIIANRKIVPCSWCKVKKYNFDMIRRYSKTGPMINMCSVNCLSLYRVSINAVNSRRTSCNYCQKLTHPMYHLTMSDATIRNFCSYTCVMGFQNQFPKQPITLNNLGESGFPVPTGAPKKNKKHPNAADAPAISEVQPTLPIISSVQSLASTNGNIGSPIGIPPTLTPISTRSMRSKSSSNCAPQILNSAQLINSYADLPVQVQIKQHFIVKPAPVTEQRNVGTMCSTRKLHKSTSMKPNMVDVGVQTDEWDACKILIPVPVPIYVPTPMRMYSVPVPVPVPFPVPIPIPIFIPTTRNSAAGIMKEIKKIQVKIPTDPYEAELLMMAEMVAEEKKEEVTDSESDVDDTAGPEDSYSPEPVDASNTFGDDMLQMALKMATELDEPAVDLEGALTANTITAPQGGEPHTQEENVDDPQPMHHMLERTPSVRGRKRGMRQPRGGAKRGRRMSHQQVDMPMMQHHQVQPPPPEPTEKPDANMCLKYTFGVNAWKQWVTTKNTELEKSMRRVKLFKTEILQLTADELNYSLCLFVKEVRKPNGAEYAPDTIYYLCLGIQQYLFENGRIDNIFCDPYYEKFTDCLDEVAKKFSVLYNDSHYIVTRVEEEHLWESKQLGAHSPHVLLSTLMFFNTKHFNLTSVDEHMQLSFSHIMKHWKRNPNQPGASKVPGSRNVLLRFYPPQSAIQNNTRKKKVYEQEQNEENPLRCPVKLYEFYLSKCPESVKTRNDVFYLQPERSCVPDSPVWYSTMPLPREALEKMLHRVKMVKEINVALLTS